MDKRGQYIATLEQFLWIARLFVIVIVVVFLIVVVNSNISKELDVSILQNEISKQAIFNCLNNFDNIESCYSNDRVGYKVILEDFNGAIKEKIVNNDIYNKKDFCQIKKSDFKCSYENYFVVIDKNYIAKIDMVLWI